jgi:hypothetical protein
VEERPQRPPEDRVPPGGFREPSQAPKPKPQKLRRVELGLVEDYLAQLRQGAGWSRAGREERRAKTPQRQRDKMEPS